MLGTHDPWRFETKLQLIAFSTLYIVSSGCFISRPDLQGPTTSWISFSQNLDAKEEENFTDGITLTDIDEISSTIPNIELVVFDHRGSSQATSRSKSEKVSLGAVKGEYFSLLQEVTDAVMVDGDFVSNDSDSGIVITDELATSLFPWESPIEKSVTIGKREFPVQGVIKYRKISLMGNMKRDVFIPLDEFDPESLQLTWLTGKEVDQLWVKVNSRDQVRPVRDVIKKLLSKNHPGVTYYVMSDF